MASSSTSCSEKYHPRDRQDEDCKSHARTPQHQDAGTQFALTSFNRSLDDVPAIAFVHGLAPVLRGISLTARLRQECRCPCAKDAHGSIPHPALPPDAEAVVCARARQLQSSPNRQRRLNRPRDVVFMRLEATKPGGISSISARVTASLRRHDAGVALPISEGG